jgi:hypothetical protein
MLKIGFAETDITPPLGTRMAGHFDDRRVESIHDPLYAHAMALESNCPLILVTCDLLSLKASTVAEIRRQVCARIDLAPEQISVSTTHTHTGPATSRIFTMDPDPQYVQTVADQAAQAALQAWEARQGAVLTVGWTFEGKLSHQRRFMMRDGRVLMHPPKGSPHILYQEGPSDPEVGVLWATDTDDNPLGCWVNFACHATSVGGGAAVSADYPGYLAAEMKNRLGEQFVTCFANGCCANLCQIDVYDTERQERGHEWARHMGETLAGDVVRAVCEGETLEQFFLDQRSVTVPLPLRDIPEDLLTWAAEIMGSPEDHEFRERCYALMAQELLEQRRLAPTVPAEITAYRLGDFALVTLPGEIFCEYGLDLKLHSPARRTFVVELANGIVGYVPTRRAFAGGGYEQRTATSSKLHPVAGEMMVATADALLKSMFC